MKRYKKMFKEAGNPLENMKIVEMIIDYLDSRQYGNIKNTEKLLSLLQKKLGSKFNSIMMYYGDPDREGFQKVYDRWRDHLLSMGW